MAHVGAGDTLVCVGGLLDRNLLLVALAGAAADGEEPEEAGSEREGDSEPEHGKHLFSHAGLDVVGFHDCLENADEGRVEEGDGKSGGECEG